MPVRLGLARVAWRSALQLVCARGRAGGVYCRLLRQPLVLHDAHGALGRPLAPSRQQCRSLAASSSFTTNASQPWTDESPAALDVESPVPKEGPESGPECPATQQGPPRLVVNWAENGGELAGTAGRVITAQANYMRVLVQWDDLTPLQRETRDEQLRAARARAVEAGVKEDIEALTQELAYQGPLEVLCVVRALLKKLQRRVFVGDFVVVSAMDWVARRGLVHSVLDRRSEILDPPVANADRLLLCFALADPPVEAVQLSRFLVSAEACELPFTLVFNKADLFSQEQRDAYATHLGEWGYEPVFLSVQTGLGVESLRRSLAGQTSVLAGPSGVGKSSLINVLRGETHQDVILGAGGGNKGRPPASSRGTEDWASDSAPAYSGTVRDGGGTLMERQPRQLTVQTVSTVSDRTRRGKHTTRHVTLLRLPGGGLLADTPGFGLPTLEHVSSRQLAEVRYALHQSGVSCSFANCAHLAEPGCVVRTDPPWERYWIYCELYEEITARERVAARKAGKLDSNFRMKATRGSGKSHLEAKLEPKRHRREQRNNVRVSNEEEDEDDGDMDEDDHHHS